MGETKHETKNSTSSFTSRTGDVIALPDDILITISAGRGLPSAITTPVTVQLCANDDNESAVNIKQSVRNFFLMVVNLS